MRFPKKTMPGRYAKKTKKSRRAPRRYRRRSRKLLSFTKAPIPNRFATKLRYVSDQNLSINPGIGGTAGVHVVSANGLYDPDITATGHQPRGFDQFMVMYDHYVVIGAKITCAFSRQNGQANEDSMIGIALKDSASVAADVNDYLEGRNTSSRPFCGGYNGAGKPSPVTVTKTASVSKFLSITHPLSSNNARGTNASNPSEQLYFHIFSAPFGAGDALPTNIWYRVEYLVVFVEPKQPTQS